MAIFPEMLPHIIQFLTASHVIVWAGIKESDTGLAVPSQWDLVSDKQMMQEEQPLQVSKARHPKHALLAFYLARPWVLPRMLLLHMQHLNGSVSFCGFWQVARCTKIINANTDDSKYVINVKQIAKVSHYFYTKATWIFSLLTIHSVVSKPLFLVTGAASPATFVFMNWELNAFGLI